MRTFVIECNYNILFWHTNKLAAKVVKRGNFFLNDINTFNEITPVSFTFDIFTTQYFITN